jgi:hypothetical protein
MQTLATTIGSSSAPMGVAIRAYSRAHDELVAAATAEPADLVYGGSTGALAAVVESARKLGVPYAVDFEDFHSGEAIGERSELQNALAERVERYVISGAAFITAASPMIAETYADQPALRPLVIHNTFIAPAGCQSAVTVGFICIGSVRRWGRDVDSKTSFAQQRSHVSKSNSISARPIPECLDSLQRLRSAVARKVKSSSINQQCRTTWWRSRSRRRGPGLRGTRPLNRQLCPPKARSSRIAAGIPCSSAARLPRRASSVHSAALRSDMTAATSKAWRARCPLSEDAALRECAGLQRVVPLNSGGTGTRGRSRRAATVWRRPRCAFSRQIRSFLCRLGTTASGA